MRGALAQAGEWTISVGGTVAYPFDASIEEMTDEVEWGTRCARAWRAAHPKTTGVAGACLS